MRPRLREADAAVGWPMPQAQTGERALVHDADRITIAVLCAAGRTRGTRSRAARVYQILARGALIAYPLLGAAYLTNRLGGIMEAVFFAGFTVIVGTQLAERTSALRWQRGAADSLPALCD